jgi:hypothetical protein
LAGRDRERLPVDRIGVYHVAENLRERRFARVGREPARLRTRSGHQQLQQRRERHHGVAPI